LGIFALFELLDILATGAPIEYFRDSPNDLLWVAEIAIAGGLVTWAFCKLPIRVQGFASILGLGALAVGATTGLGFCVYAFISLASIEVELGVSVWNPLPIFLPVVFLLPLVAVYYWIACWRAWRKEIDQAHR